MVDREKRRTLKRVGIAGGILGCAGYGAFHSLKELAAAHAEWQEQRPPLPERWAQDVEQDIRNDEGGDGLYWEQTYVDVDAVDVTYETVGRSEADAPRYRFTARAPLETDNIDICDYAGSREAMADLAAVLERDSLKLYEELFDTLGQYIVAHQDADDPAVSSLAVRYVDGTGTAGFSFDSDTLDVVAIDHAFVPENFRDRANFQQPYRATFTVACGDSDGR